MEDLGAALAEKKIEQLTLIIKGDNSGTVEALEDSLLKLDVGEEVDLRVVHRGVGGITQDDINLAVITDAMGKYDEALAIYDQAMTIGKKDFYSEGRAACAKRKADAEALAK